MNQKFIKLQENLYGKEKAQKWLKRIPEILRELKIKWNLEIGEEFELSYNYVISVIRKDGTQAVLKIYFLENPEYMNQLTTLQIFNGEGAVKVLESDNKNFAILLERCVPGNTLSSLDDEEKETLVFTEVLKKLWKKPSGTPKFKNISSDLVDFDWYFSNFNKIKYPLSKDLVREAQKKFKYLIETQKDLYLLHSDLHHENILSSERGWLAIDPKGVIGEKEFEVAAFMRNPIKRAKENLLTKEILIKRLDTISDKLNLNRQRILGWAFAQTVLSVIWSIQISSGKEEYWIKIAKEIEKI